MSEQQVNIENLSLASNSKRVKAFIIDDLLITFLTLVMLWNPISSTGGDLMAIMILMNQAFVQIIALKFFYQAFFVWYYGATLGKMAAGIRIIDYNTFQRVSLQSALLRSAVRIISESAFYVGFVMAYYTEARQTLHDKIAKTLVVDA